MEFTPLTDEELAMEGLFPAGIYPFNIDAAEDAISKSSGKPMMKLTVRIYGDGGGQKVLFDYLMPAFPRKLSEFCKLTGLDAAYKAGALNAQDCVGRQGYVSIKRTPAKDGYDPKNEIGFYCPKPEATLAGAPAGRLVAKTNDLEELDAIPF